MCKYSLTLDKTKYKQWSHKFISIILSEVLSECTQSETECIFKQN